MPNAITTIILCLGLAAWEAVGMFIGYRRGRIPAIFAPSWTGAITRKGRPTKFRRFMIGSVMAIVTFLGVALWAAVLG
jgi:hypothetical protein